MKARFSLPVLFLIFLSPIPPTAASAQSSADSEDERWLQAVEKYSEGDYGAALVLLQRIVRDQASAYESCAWLLLGRSHLHLNHLPEAEEAADQLLLRYPHGRYAAYASYLRAQINFLKEDRYGAAVNLAQSAQSAQDDELNLLARTKLERIFELYLRGDERQRLMAWVKQPEIRAELLSVEQGYRLPYRIGVILPLSGRQSEVGLSILSGIEEACAEARRRMRLEIEITARDSRGSAVEAIRAAHSLIAEEGALALIGELSDEASSGVAAVAAERGTALLLPAVRQSDITGIGENVYQMQPDYSTEGAAAAEYLARELGLKRAALLAPASAEGMARVDGFCSYFENAGGVLAGLQWYHQETTDFRRLLAALVQPLNPSMLNPPDSAATDTTLSEAFDAKGSFYTDSSFMAMPLSALEALYLPVQGEEMALLGPQLALLGFHGVLIGSSACLDFLGQEATRRYFDGMIFPSALPDLDGWQPDSDFDRIYRSRTGAFPNRWNALGWDTFNLLAQGFRDEGKLSCRRIVQRLSENQRFEGVQQLMIFRPEERMNHAIYILKYEDGKPRELGTVQLDGFHKS